MNSTATDDRVLTLDRRLTASPEQVFRAWTEPDRLAWFANPGYPLTIPTTVDLRVGGAWRIQMIENPDKQYITGGVYREIEPPGLLSFYWGAVGGWPPLDPARLEESPVITVRLAAEPGGARMTVELRFADHLSDDEVARWFALGVKQGLTMTIDRLAPYLEEQSAGDNEPGSRQEETAPADDRSRDSQDSSRGNDAAHRPAAGR